MLGPYLDFETSDRQLMTIQAQTEPKAPYRAEFWRRGELVGHVPLSEPEMSAVVLESLNAAVYRTLQGESYLLDIANDSNDIIAGCLQFIAVADLPHDELAAKVFFADRIPRNLRKHG